MENPGKYICRNCDHDLEYNYLNLLPEVNELYCLYDLYCPRENLQETIPVYYNKALMKRLISALDDKNVTKEDCREVSLKYKCKREFFNNSYLEFMVCYKNDWFEECCNHFHFESIEQYSLNKKKIDTRDTLDGWRKCCTCDLQQPPDSLNAMGVCGDCVAKVKTISFAKIYF